MTRRRSIIGALVLLVLLGVTLSLALPTSPASGKGFFGVSAAQGPTDRDYTMMRKAGVASMRFNLTWSIVQASAGPCKATTFDGSTNTCNWASTDQTMASLAREHITPLVDLGATPPWLNHRSGTFAGRYTPLEAKGGKKAWVHFVTAAAQRYGPKGTFWQQNPDLPKTPIRIWQIWNEQNWSQMFRPKASPKLYGALLKASAKALHSVDRKAKVMLGGMFGTPGGGGAQALTAWKFLGGLLKKKSVRKSFDYVALHPYSPTVAGINYQLKKLHHVLKAHHDNAQIWVTELGWGSDKKHVHNHLVFTPKKQKKMLVKSFKLLLHKRHAYNIGGAIWFSWRDPDPQNPTCNFCYSSGLLQNNYKPKPSFHAFKKFAPGP